MADIEETQTIDGKTRIVEKLAASDTIGREQFQPLSTDWIDMNTSLFTYGSPISITLGTFDSNVYFQVGDKLRIKQADSENYKYFYVMGTPAGELKITSGDSYNFTNSAIIELALSRVGNPYQFPDEFVWNLFPTDQDDNPIGYVSGEGYAIMGFTMEGTYVTATVNILDLDVDNTMIEVRLPMPFIWLDTTGTIIETSYAPLLVSSSTRYPVHMFYAAGPDVSPFLYYTLDDVGFFPNGYHELLITHRFKL